MGSSYFGEPSLGNGRSGSSRKGKKNNSDKPKQPQRGLGVAQLEKLRLHNQMNCGYLPNIHTHHPYTNLNQEDGVRVEEAYPALSSSSSFAYTSTTSSASSFGFHPNIMMGMAEMDVTEYQYSDAQSNTTSRWNYSDGTVDAQYSMQLNTTQQFLSLNMEDSVKKKRGKDWFDSMSSSSQKLGSGDTQEIDLDLKLSL